MRGPTGRVLGAALGGVLAGLLALLLAEALLRAAVGVLPAPVRQVVDVRVQRLGVAHPYIGHLGTPAATFVVEGRDFRAVHRTDPHGFRNAWPWPRSADVVVLGDSVTFGHGVEDGEAWPAVLARRLGARLVNLGLTGSGTEQHVRIYETFGAPLAPRLVLVGFFARNDFWDTGLFDRWLGTGVGGNYLAWRDTGRPSRPDGGGSPVRGLVRASYLYHAARYVWSAGRRRVSRQEVYTFADGTRVRLLPDDFAEKTRGAHPGERELALVVGALERLRGLTAPRGVRLVVAFLPSKEEVYLPLLGAPVEDPTRPLRQALAAVGIESVDLAPTFRAEAARRRLFFEEDGHPNAAGQALIAEGVLRELHARGLVASLRGGVPRR